jgi:Legionella pneumophila major outer membrane protein precursor
MKSTRLLTIGWLLMLALPALARTQTFVAAPLDGLSGNVSLLPMAGPDGATGPLFLSTGDLRGQGNAGGKSAGDLNNLQIGFDYLRPYWTSRDFTLAVPAASAGNFPLLGDTGNVDSHFAMVPRVNYKYDVVDLNFSVNATGTFLSLSGHLERKVTDTNAGQGDLTANSALTIITANLPEFSTRVYYGDVFNKQSCLYCPGFDDMAIDLGVGTRYSSIAQNYTGSLTNSVPAGSNVSTRYSTQSFQGIGLTTRMDFSLPVGDNLVLFTNLRGSILVGDSTQDSTLNVNVVGMPGLSSAINQTRTEFIPVGEMDMGLEWGQLLGKQLRDNAPPPLFTIRVAAVTQFWGGVGPLSAGSPQGFRTSNLYLVGAHVMIGFHR